MGSYITSVVRWNAAAVDNDAQDDKSNNSNDLDQAENEFDLAISSDTENVDQNDQHEEDRDPHPDIDRWIASILWVGP